IYGVTLNEKPSEFDLNFLKNNLFKFINKANNIELIYLTNESSYSLSSNNLQKLNNILPNVKDYDSWVKYVDSIATYDKLENLLINLNGTFTNLYPFQLNNNSLFTYDTICLLRMKYSYSNSISYITIVIYILLFILIILVIHKISNKK
ncbi:MAG: hypothetical protein K2I49_02860, partial [Ureaplasma sp.]|nr:hypothetical protein [Ureaplasma sp.]